MLSPLGTDVASTWEGILAGRSGIRRIDHFDTENFSTKFAGLVPDFAMDEYLSGKEARKMDVFVQYGMVAAIQALLTPAWKWIRKTVNASASPSAPASAG
jgi:3-oxoacyl-[acyl-carrier-protein] synthase II